MRCPLPFRREGEEERFHRPAPGHREYCLGERLPVVLDRNAPHLFDADSWQRIS
jgi:hypothetical protein